VAAGWARADAHAPDLAGDEAAARALHVGIWRAGDGAAAF
jgi:endonuclease YncB( thermonuclease family)